MKKEIASSSNTKVGFIRFFLPVLSWLLHHANREGRNEYFYKIKNRILSKYSIHLGYDVQFIAGKKCFTCGGTGTYEGYDFKDDCRNCDGTGWYKLPVYNILARVQFGNYLFHQPFKRTFIKPKTISSPIIQGYITHNRSQYGKFALFILFLFFDKHYLKRCFGIARSKWHRYWKYNKRAWLPRTVFKIKLFFKELNVKRRFIKSYNTPQSHAYIDISDDDELPF